MGTVKIVRLHELAGPDVLQIEELLNSEPAAGEVRIKVSAFGLNRAEIIFRMGIFPEQPRIGAERRPGL
jgi:NADPH:quinone reductase-like Zn-dependent oxidoreductase